MSDAIRAQRGDVEGTVTFRDPGPQWGAFHPGGDESIVVPLVKRDADVTWEEPCLLCGEPVMVCLARLEILGAYHDGCFGYPACTCVPSHRGDCP